MVTVEIGDRVRVVTSKYGADQFHLVGTVFELQDDGWFWIRIDNSTPDDVRDYQPDDIEFVSKVNGPW